MKKKLFYALLLVVVAGGGYGIYLFNKKPVDTRDVDPDFEVTAAALVKEFNDNETDATRKYVDKVLVVTGKVSSLDVPAASVTLEGSDPLASVTCSFYADEATSMGKLKVGDVVGIKGKCTGKLMDVVLNECSLNTKAEH